MNANTKSKEAALWAKAEETMASRFDEKQARATLCFKDEVSVLKS